MVRILSVAAGLLVWEWVGRLPSSHLVLPPASAVAGALAGRLRDPSFWTAALTTMQAFVIGAIFIVAVGVPSGLLIGRVPLAQRFAEPYVQALLAVPVSPLVPLFMIVFGAGLAARVATVFAFGVAVLVVNTAAGVRLTPPPLIRMAESFGARPAQVFRYVALPAALPGVMAGLRLASGRAVVGTVVSELIIISVGLGKMIGQYSVSFEVANLYAVVVTLLGLGLGIAAAMAWLERRVLRWQ